MSSFCPDVDDEENMTAEAPISDNKATKFTTLEITNLACQVLCYGCLMSSTSMIIGTAAPVVRSVGGYNSWTPIPVGICFLGSSGISLLTPYLFGTLGRRGGFLVGNLLGVVGAALGGLAIWITSPILVLVAYLPLGMSYGIGNHLRFAALEVVQDPSKKSLAVTLVLTGGVIAAFLGPESAQATKAIFGQDLEYLGTFMMILIFNVTMGIFQRLIRYPKDILTSNSSFTLDKEQNVAHTSLYSLFWTFEFIIPVFIASFCWAIMVLPMSIVRVAMSQLGYTSRQTLLIIEFHFFGMFAPGFVSGTIIDRKGEFFTFYAAIGIFVIMSIVNLVWTSFDDTITSWSIGLFLAGVGWNFGFSSSTLLLTQAYVTAPHLKTKVQAANDFIMFLFAGSLALSTGYVFEGGGGGLEGWMAVNYVVLSLIVVMSFGVWFCTKLAH